MMDHSYSFKISSLIYKQLTNSFLKQEEKEFQAIIASDKRVLTILTFFENPQNWQERLAFLAGIDVDMAKKEVKHKYLQKKRKLYRRLFKYAAALAIFSLIGLYYIFPEHNSSNSDNQPNRILAYEGLDYTNDILPGEEKASLLLSNGSVIALGKGQTQWVELDGSILMEDKGELIYKSEAVNLSEGLFYNTLTVPKAGIYQVTLSDASKVWLNAKSILTYPVNFNAKERLVELQGEAFFDVSKDVNRPFVVKTKGSTITVLGTSFNVNAYQPNSIYTTLFTGQVRVNYPGKEKLIRPGQMLLVKGSHASVELANLEKTSAWKNGYFYFDSETVHEVMQQLSRWYGLKIHYQEGLYKQQIGGSISRDVKLSEVLEMLKDVSNLRFRIDGNTLEVSENK